MFLLALSSARSGTGLRGAPWKPPCAMCLLGIAGAVACSGASVRRVNGERTP